MMKVLHLSSERTWRGGEQQIAYLIEELEKLGVENFVACRKGSAFEEYCISKGINHISVGFKNQFDLMTALRIKQFCSYLDIDIMHAHSSHSHAQMVWSGMLGNKAKQVLARRVDFPPKTNTLSLFKYNYPKIKSIICVSEAIRNMMKVAIKDSSKLQVVYDGILLGRFQKERTNKLRNQLGLESSDVLIGNIAAIAPHKDYFTFVDTAKILHQLDEKLHFVIIGDGPMFDEINLYIKDMGLQEVITMTGFRDDIEEIAKDLDIFLFTSETEGLGSSLLDIMSVGVPIVATKAGGIPEIIQHETNGLLGEVKNSQELANFVIELVNKPDRREFLVANAQSYVAKFDKSIMAKETLNMYNSI